MKLSVESAKITVYRAYENARRGDVPLIAHAGIWSMMYWSTRTLLTNTFWSRP